MRRYFSDESGLRLGFGRNQASFADWMQ